MRAVVDPDKCIGCTLCTQICPEIFKMEGDKAVAYLNPVPDKLINSCRQAAEQCPVEAISISE
ncbi:MAG: ferredoxin [Candidatus Omnitrophica bacterium]|nr:ferredoxin [Candidatus Omnitrophota bacterium]MDD5653537.1 ferredoxin [Candidatus Omnitrophota bacterium]